MLHCSILSRVISYFDPLLFYFFMDSIFGYQVGSNMCKVMYKENCYIYIYIYIYIFRIQSTIEVIIQYNDKGTKSMHVFQINNYTHTEITLFCMICLYISCVQLRIKLTSNMSCAST